MIRAIAGTLSLLFALTAAAQNVTLGSMPNNADTSLPIFGLAPVTIIDFGTPARAAGSVYYGTARWDLDDPSADCTGAFKVKVLRPDASVWGRYETVGDTGPIEALDGYTSFDFGGREVAVERGDLLALTVLKGNCGGVRFASAEPAGAILLVDGELAPEGTLTEVETFRIGPMVVQLSGDSDVRQGVIVVAGSAQGSFGSSFKTAIQLTNPDWENRADGDLIFRRAGVPGSDSDPSIEYHLAEGETLSIADLGTAMGVSGLGSVDIVPWNRTALPVVSTRVFNDTGATGTLGFNEPVQLRGEELRDAQVGTFITPADLANFRMNVGIRSLGEGATVIVQSITSTGDPASSLVVKEYPADFFTQVSLAEFLGETPVADGQVYVRVVEGSAFIYTSTTDNRTNDSSIEFVKRPD